MNRHNPLSHIESVGVGLPLVFLHGFPLDRGLWKRQVRYFGSTHRVVTVDLPGFGNASPADKQRLPNMASYAADVAAALSESGINEPLVLVGLSMGGYVALEFWRQFADRLAGLVLCHTKATADTAVARAGRHESARTAVNSGTEASVGEMLKKLLSAQSEIEQPELTRWLRQTAIGMPPSAIEAAQLAMAARDDFTDHLANVRLPVLVLAGTDDEIATTETMNAMARRMPTARFQAVHDAAHLSPIEQPDEFNRILDEFLQRIKPV